jgi:hypothetical protein
LGIGCEELREEGREQREERREKREERREKREERREMLRQAQQPGKRKKKIEDGEKTGRENLKG